jgi:hypothetical protein
MKLLRYEQALKHAREGLFVMQDRSREIDRRLFLQLAGSTLGATAFGSNGYGISVMTQVRQSIDW